MHNTTLLSPPDLWSLGPVKRLNSDYREALRRVYNFLLPLGKARPLGSEEFTDHDLAHSTRIIERIDKILPPKVKLNQPELYILLLSALLHDMGMWMPRKEAFELFEDEEFLTFCRRYYPLELPEVQSSLNSVSRRWMGEMGLQRLAAAYARAHHPKRSADLLLSESPGPHIEPLRVLVDPAFLFPVALVCEAHSWERRRVLEDPELEPREIGGVLVNLRFLAVLLRLGDLLDLGEGRISSLLWAYLRPLSAVSETHWRKEAALRLDRCEADLIQVSGSFDINRDGILAADAFTLACDWLQWLYDEINECAILLERRQPPALAKKYYFGKLELHREGVKAIGLVLGGTVGFHLDGDRVMELLGSEIYSQGAVFVRELIQNAIDATRAQMIRDVSKNSNGSRLPLDAPWDWPRDIAGSAEYAIDVATGQEQSEGRQFDTFFIRDRGIGMTLQHLSDYLLQIGRSFYRTPRFLKEFSYPSISRFGIGFASCLIADRIEVVTRAWDEPAGLRLVLRKPSKQFTVTRAAEAEFGTTVKLWIDPERARANGWDLPPRSPKDRAQEFELQEAADGPANPYGFAAKLWCLWTEMPLVVDGVPWGPRSIRTEPRVLKSTFGRPHAILERRWFPFLIRTAKGATLAEGNLGLFALPGNGLPIYPDYVSSLESYITNLISVRGIWVLNQRGYNGPDYQLNLNFLSAPRNTLSASRSIRGSWMADMVSAVGKAAILKVLHYTYDHLRQVNPMAAAVWRLSVDVNEKADLPPLMIPYRTRSEAGWASEEELIERFDRFLLVPMLLAMKGPWDLDVPCVGYLYPRIHRKLERTSHCSLVTIKDLCTGLLYPPDARMDGLEPFQGTMTRTFEGTHVWKKSRAGFRTIENAVTTHSFSGQVPEALINDEELRSNISPPPYEEGGRNPWKEMAFHPEEIWGEVRRSSEREYAEMRALLSGLGPIDYPENLLDLTYEAEEDWE